MNENNKTENVGEAGARWVKGEKPADGIKDQVIHVKPFEKFHSYEVLPKTYHALIYMGNSNDGFDWHWYEGPNSAWHTKISDEDWKQIERLDESPNPQMAGEISPVLSREDVAAVKEKLQGDRADYLERAEAEGTSKNEDFEAGYMACIRRMNGVLNLRLKQIPPTPAPEVKDDKPFRCCFPFAPRCPTQCEGCKNVNSEHPIPVPDKGEIPEDVKDWANQEGDRIAARTYDIANAAEEAAIAMYHKMQERLTAAKSLMEKAYEDKRAAQNIIAILTQERDECAKQQSIGFQKWIWETDNLPELPIEELYSQFIEHQNKQQ